MLIRIVVEKPTGEIIVKLRLRRIPLLDQLVVVPKVVVPRSLLPPPPVPLLPHIFTKRLIPLLLIVIPSSSQLSSPLFLLHTELFLRERLLVPFWRESNIFIPPMVEVN